MIEADRFASFVSQALPLANNLSRQEECRVVTILIVEDHTLLCQTLQSWLETNLSPDHVIETASGPEAVEMAAALRPQVVIVDVDIQPLEGFELVQRIKAAAPGAQVVVLAPYQGQAHRADAARAGASTCVAKSALQTELVPALKALLTGRGT
jgi:DNA-binding NarL/FixJ family response regulator